MSQDKENLNFNSKKNHYSSKNKSKKKAIKEKKTIKKLPSHSNIKVVPLLKPPSKRRKFNKDGKMVIDKKEHNQSGIKWDNKIIQDLCLEKKQHPKIKEEKTLYPDGDKEDLYEEAVNKVNEIKPTEEILNNVIDVLNNKGENEKKLELKRIKKRTYSSQYPKTLKFYDDICNKFDNLSGENKISLQNTLINKFHKEVRDLSKEKV